jgi:hypothetical protein
MTSDNDELLAARKKEKEKSLREVKGLESKYLATRRGSRNVNFDIENEESGKADPFAPNKDKQ